MVEPGIAIFARVSTSRQDTDRQVSDLRALVESRYHGAVVHTLIEVMSGSTLTAQRPQVQQLLHLARTGQIKKVLVTEVSRLGRKTVEVLTVLDELTKAGVSVFVLNYQMETLLPNGKRNPMASLLFTVVAEFAQLEKENLVERIKSGMAEAKRKGVHTGRAKGTAKEDKAVLKDYPKVVGLLRDGLSVRAICKLTDVSDKTVQRVKRILAAQKVG